MFVFLKTESIRGYYVAANQNMHWCWRHKNRLEHFLHYIVPTGLMANQFEVLFKVQTSKRGCDITENPFYGRPDFPNG